VYTDGAVELITKALPRVKIDTVYFSDWEVLKYTVGGFFAEHVDRSRGTDHLGTVLAIFGTEDVEGGDLRTGGDVVWPAGCRQPHLVFISLGVNHEVTRVRKGERYAAKASVFGHVDDSGDLENIKKKNDAVRKSYGRED
jgi:hypothetical protein